jgi:hypothetical protein
MRYDDCETDDSIEADDGDERSSAGSVQGLQLVFAAWREIPANMITIAGAFANWKWCVRTEGLSEDENHSDDDGDSEEDQGSNDDGYSGNGTVQMMLIQRTTVIQVMIRIQIRREIRVLMILRSPLSMTGIGRWCLWGLSIQL